MNVRKHLKCFALFVGIVIGALVLGVGMVLGMELLKSAVGLGWSLVILGGPLLAGFAWFTHDICKDW
jgi:hypothetical protein